MMTPTPSKHNSFDRRQFFGCLNTMRSRLERHGVSTDDIRGYYANRFGVSRMRYCTQQEWAIAAAEVSAMVRSPEVFSVRITGITKGGYYGDADAETQADQQLGGG